MPDNVDTKDIIDLQGDLVIRTGTKHTIAPYTTPVHLVRSINLSTPTTHYLEFQGLVLMTAVVTDRLAS